MKKWLFCLSTSPSARGMRKELSDAPGSPDWQQFRFSSIFTPRKKVTMSKEVSPPNVGNCTPIISTLIFSFRFQPTAMSSSLR